MKENTFLNHICDKDLTSRLYKELLQLIKKKEREKETNFLNEHFSKEDTQTANKHMERFSISLVNRKVHIKTKMRYHFTPTEMARINRSDNNRA